MQHTDSDTISRKSVQRDRPSLRRLRLIVSKTTTDQGLRQCVFDTKCAVGNSEYVVGNYLMSSSIFSNVRNLVSRFQGKSLKLFHRMSSFKDK